MTLEDGAPSGSGSRRHGGDELQVQPPLASPSSHVADPDEVKVAAGTLATGDVAGLH